MASAQSIVRERAAGEPLDCRIPVDSQYFDDAKFAPLPAVGGTALLARDRGFPTLTHQVLICPMLDDRLETPSSRMLDGEGMWDRNDNLFGWTALLGDRQGGDDVSIYAAPARATDLSGLPRSYVDVGTVESFRDEAITYAQRLAQAGVNVDLHLWGGGFHGSDLMAPHAAISRASQAARDEFLRRALEG